MLKDLQDLKTNIPDKQMETDDLKSAGCLQEKSADHL